MNITSNREERKEQKAMLRALYDDYNPVHHDYFVERYNKDQDKDAITQYMKNRGIIQ